MIKIEWDTGFDPIEVVVVIVINNIRKVVGGNFTPYWIFCGKTAPKNSMFKQQKVICVYKPWSIKKIN